MADQIGPAPGWQLGIALALLIALALATSHGGRLGTGRKSAFAVARAIVQLAVVATFIEVALDHLWSAWMFVAAMWMVASGTSAGRIEARSDALWVAAALLGGAVPVLALVFVTGSTPVSPASVLAISGIVIGGTMTACSLAGRRAFAALAERAGEVEAALALGLAWSEAVRLVIDRDRPEALVPVLDQTRTVGLVTLPGAFVGVLLGGGSPAEAAAAQIVVLAGLVAAQSITVVLVGRFVAQRRLLSADLRNRLPVA